MFGIGTGELLMILVIAMLVVGPERMVDYARRGGRLLTKLREQTDVVTKDFRDALKVESADGEDVNPLTALTQMKNEAEEAVRDMQGMLSGKPSSAAAEKAQSTPAAASATPPAVTTEPKPEIAAQAAPTEPAPEPAGLEQTGVDLGGVELIDDDQMLELGGPELVEADEVAESEASS